MHGKASPGLRPAWLGVHMKSICLALICAGVASAQTSSAKPTAPPPPVLITEPAWIKLPGGDDMARVYPGDAQARGVEGRAIIQCDVALDGLLRNCRVVEETPPGYGFGVALLLLAPQFKMKPATRNGVPVSGSVNIPVNFKLSGGGTRSTSAKAPAIGPNDRVMIGRIVWDKAPTAQDVVAARPAGVAGEGHTVLQCRFTRERTLHDCETVQSSRENRRFDAAARSLVKNFRAREFSNGRPHADDLVELAFTFDAPGTDPDVGGAALTWSESPDPADLAKLFTAEAKAAKISTAKVQLDCLTGGDGSLSECRVLKENPAGFGFGAAALQLASKFRFNPWTEDGRPVGGRRIVLPLRLVDNLEPSAVRSGNLDLAIGQCEGLDADGAQVIAACTAVIATPLVPTRDYAVAYARRAATYAGQKDYDRALADIEALFRLNPNDAAAYRLRGEIEFQKGDETGALADFDKAVDLEPENSNARNNACFVRALANRDLDHALSDCNEAQRLAPKSAAILDSRAFVYFRLGRFDDAIADDNAALAKAPKLAAAFYVRGLAKHAKGDAAGAAADIATARALRPTIADTYARHGVNQPA